MLYEMENLVFEDEFNEEEMVSWKINKIDTLSPLRNGTFPSAALSPRKKQLRSKSNSSLGSLATAWDKKSNHTWVREHFYQRECFKFVPDPKKPSGEQCCCGRLLGDHNDPITVHNTVQWTPDSCTRKSPTNAFGEIQFVGSANQSSRSPYVRLAEDSNVDVLMKLILKVWAIEVPNLVISVTGGAKSFHLKPRLKEVFQRGLIKAAKSTGAWIITGGTNTGVMKHVGEAVRQMKVVGGASSDINVLGVATWGIVDRDSDLISDNGFGKYPARYHSAPEESSKAPLDSSHTHFLLVDNGTVGQYGVEIDLRAKVEEAISKLHTESRSTTGSIEVPIVMLVLEGGPGTVRTMTEAIKKKIPAVVIDGSGRAADVVAFAYKHTISITRDGKSIHVIDPDFKHAVQSKVIEIFGSGSLDSVYKMIEDVLEDEKMITIYRLDEDGNTSRDIDLAILKALLKASRSSPRAQLNLALAWNRVDVAESDIFTDNNRFKPDDLHEPMLTALLDEKVDFVRLFLENGLSMREFLCVERISILYRSICNSGVLGSLVRHQMKKRGSKFMTPQLVGYVLEELMGDSYHSYYHTNGRYFTEPTRASQLTLRKRGTLNSIMEQTLNLNRMDPLQFPFLDVFTWAILSGKGDLAKLLWEKAPNPIANALFATQLLKAMAIYSQGDHHVVDTSEGLVDLADEFEKMALGVLDCCYHNDEDIAQKLLVQSLEPFGFLTCMDIAQLAGDQDFIAHSACQILFNQLWMGGINVDTPWWKVFLCVFFPFLIYPLIYFVEYDEYEEVYDNTLYDEEEPSKKEERGGIENNNAAKVVANDVGRRVESVEMTEQIENKSYQAGSQTTKTNFNDNPVQAADGEAFATVVPDSHDTKIVDRIYKFYEAPFTKFVTNVCSYVVFLGMFWYVMLMDFQKYSVSIVEYVLIGWVIVLMMEETRQITSQQPKHIIEKFSLYLNDTWNFVDILSLLAFAVASILRFFPDKFGGNMFEAARIIYIVDIILFIVRTLQMFSVNRQLGPKLVMIKTMLEDLKQFIIILAVFILSYGVALQAALYPNTENFWDVVIGVVKKPYFQMYGELFFDDFEENQSEIHGSGRWLGPVLLAFHMLLTNILLLNLLIAIFNYTFEKIQEGSDRVWKFQRYNLIREYNDRPNLAPPLMFLSHVYMFVKWIIHLCGCCYKLNYRSSLRVIYDDHQNEQLSSWENHNKEMDIIRAKAELDEKMEKKVKTIDAKVDALSNHLERMMESSFEPGQKSDKTSVRLKSAGPRRSRELEISFEQRITHIEEQMFMNTQTLDKILDIVSSARTVLPGTIQAAEYSSVHVKSRKSPYPRSTVSRITLSDEMVPWTVSYSDYNPPEYTDPCVSKKPPWADDEIMTIHPRPQLKFNHFDEKCNVDRTSYTGSYKIVSGLPRNPMGRTGLTGRGLLGRFGPNHAVDPIVTRWKMTSSGALVENGKKVLEFVAIQRKDNQEWAIPGGMVEPGEQISKTLQKEFMEEALSALDLSSEELQTLKKRVDSLFQKGKEVFKGYVDDPRNTDVAWVETLAVNFHDDSGDIFNKIKLQAGDDATAVRWQRVSGNIPLYANHASILENVAKLHNANF